jgi:hypothetical protein
MSAVMIKNLFNAGCKHAPGFVAGLRSMAPPLGCWRLRRLTAGPFVLYLMESALGLVAHYGAGGVGVVVGLVGVVLVLVLVLADLLFDLLALVLVSWARSSLYSIASALCMEVGGWTGSCWWRCWRRSSLVVVPFALVLLLAPFALVPFALVPFVVAPFALVPFRGRAFRAGAVRGRAVRAGAVRGRAFRAGAVRGGCHLVPLVLVCLSRGCCSWWCHPRWCLSRWCVRGRVVRAIPLMYPLAQL